MGQVVIDVGPIKCNVPPAKDSTHSDGELSVASPASRLIFKGERCCSRVEVTAIFRIFVKADFMKCNTGQDGAFQRFSVEYDLTDSVKITGGAVLYQSGDLARHKNIGDNDRIFVEIKYSF